MKRKYIIGAAALALIGLATTACSNNSDSSSDRATSKNYKKLDKELDTSKADKSASYRFKGKTYKTNKGTITIDKLTRVALREDDEIENYAIIEATFTNNSKKGVTPEDFFNDNFKVEQKLANSSHELGSDRSSYEDDLTQWKSGIDARLNKVDPGKTVKFVMPFELDKDNGDKDVDTYLIQPIDAETNDEIGKPLKLKASNKVSVNAPKDDADTDTDDTDDLDD